MSRETEAKFLVADRASFNRLKALRELGSFILEEGHEVDVRDTYHDTPERALLGAGWALRCRQAGGRCLVTAKSLAPASGPVHEREEVEVALDRFSQPEEWPESGLRGMILALIGAGRIEPLVEVHQKRFVRQMLGRGGPCASMSLDEVHLFAGGRQRRYRELEIELIPPGTTDDLSSMIAALGGAISLVPSPRSKFEEALLLLGRRDASPSARQRDRDEPARELEAPAGATEATILSELHRLGYRSRARTRKGEETRFYVDTQGGALLREGTELYFSSGDSRWHLLRKGRQDLAQKGGRDAVPSAGPIARKVEAVTRSRPGVFYLEATLRETSFSLLSISGSRLGLTQRQWQLRPLLHQAPPQPALTFVLVRGQASSFDRDYLLGLMTGALGLKEIAAPVLRFGLQRLGVPLPGAPLPSGSLAAAEDAAPAVCRKVLAGEAWRMYAQTPGAVRDLDPEFVHDLRVATRRARFACRLFVPVLGPESEKIRSELSWVAGLLGGVRDLDVLRARLASQFSLIDSDPSFAPVIDGLLASRRADAREKLVPALSSQRYSALLDLMRSAGQDSSAGGLSAREFAGARIGRALDRIARWTERDPSAMTPVELHRLRILFKRLRYTAEFFRPIFAEEIERLVRECVIYQDCLGLHQDARVAAEALAGLATAPELREPPERLLALGSLVQVQRDLMRVQREKFQALWGSFPKLLRLWPGRA